MNSLMKALQREREIKEFWDMRMREIKEREDDDKYWPIVIDEQEKERKIRDFSVEDDLKSFIYE